MPRSNKQHPRTVARFISISQYAEKVDRRESLPFYSLEKGNGKKIKQRNSNPFRFGCKYYISECVAVSGSESRAETAIGSRNRNVVPAPSAELNSTEP